MQWVSVISSNISEVAYNEGLLFVAFNKGGIYQYDGVPIEVFNNLIRSPSAGEYFAKYIKNVYPYRRC